MKRFLILGSIAAIAVSAAFGAALLTQAQTSTSTSVSGVAGITFPIPELGNCGSKDECRAYCNDPTNADACIAFGEAHGLLSQAEASSSQQFAHQLQNGGGPGGCTTPDACKAYCSDLAHLDECLAFAKQNGLKNSDVSQAEKIAAYVKSGGTMPSGCTSKNSCEAYCGDFSHAEECANFAEKAGLSMEGGPNASNTAPGQFQKFIEAVKNGEAPGGCTSKDACETYCADKSHFTECLAFAQKAGFVSSSTAQGLSAAGGTGPGGCDSQEACQSYCNDASHRDECFAFAKEHNLIPQDQLDNAQKGLTSLRAGLENAPPEVQSCISSGLGSSTIQDIETGAFTPGPDIGQQIKSCFEASGASRQFSNPFSRIPPEALACVKEKLGSDFSKVQSGSEQPTPEMGDAVRVCFQSLQFGGNAPSNMGGGNGAGGIPPSQFLPSAPPEITQCLKDKLGDTAYNDLLGATTLPVGDVKQTMEACFQSFRPQGEGMGGAYGQGSGGPNGGPGSGNSQGGANGFTHLPQAVQDCVSAAVGSDTLQSLEGGNEATPDERRAIQKCFGQSNPNGTPGMMPPPGGFGPSTRPEGAPPGFSQLPPEVSACVKAALGDDIFQKISSGEVEASAIGDAMRKCAGAPSSSPNFGNQTMLVPGGENQPNSQSPDGMINPSGTYQMPPLGGATSATCPAGQLWNGSACVDPAQQCAAASGTWTGTSCQMPPASDETAPPPPPSSFLDPSTTFGALLQVFAPILGM